jgi:hypothetical protein
MTSTGKFKVTSYEDVWDNLTYEEMRLKEAFYRGMRQSYVIIYPDGYKITCEVVKNDEAL